MKIKKLEDSYKECVKEGLIRKKEDIDIELAKSLLDSSKKEINVYKDLEKKIKYYSIIFKSRYDILRKLISAFLLFDKVKISNHQCTNAYLCKEHPELDIEWEILEAFRVLRNKITYEGKQIDYETWKIHKPKFEVYIKTFIKEVEKKTVKS